MSQQEVVKSPTVKYPLRLPKAINDALREQAAEQGMSVNNVIVMHLARSLGERVKLFRRGKKAGK